MKDINIKSLDNNATVVDFLNQLNYYPDDLYIKFEQQRRIYPKVILPIYGYLNEYQQKTNKKIYFHNEPYELERIGFFTERTMLEVDDLERLDDSFNKIWKFWDDGKGTMGKLQEKLVNDIARKTILGKDIWEALIWPINELMDNAVRHSKKSYAWICCKAPTDNKLEFAVFDTGVGIFTTLRNSKFAPVDAFEALEMSIQQGVTDGTGQGYGLFGVYKIVQETGGQLSIASNGAGVWFGENNTQGRFNELIHERLPILYGCLVEFQIRTDKSIDLPKLLGGTRPVNLYIESLEDEVGNMIYNLREKNRGLTNRPAGIPVRNEVLNLISYTSSKIIIDFTGIDFISSSFADEFIAKLVSKIGFINFNSRISLKGMNQTIASLIDIAITDRLIRDKNGN